MAAPLTYQQYLSTYGLTDTPANNAKYNLAAARGTFGSTQTSSPTSTGGQAPNLPMAPAIPVQSGSGDLLSPAKAIGAALFSRAPLANPTDVFPSDPSMPRLNQYPSFAEYQLALNNYNQAMKGATGGLTVPHAGGPSSTQSQSPDRTPQSAASPAAPAPVTAAIPIATTSIQPINTPGPAPVITTTDAPAPAAKKGGTAQDLAKIAATAMGGLGDAFSARAAALAGRSFAPEQTMQNKQLEFQGEQNAADRAQTMQLQAKNAALQTGIAQLQSKTQLTEADKNNIAAMQRQQALIAAQLRQAIIEKGGLPGADSLGIR